MNTKKIKYRWLYTILFSALSIAWVFPILLVIQNSFKKKVYISRKPFELPLGKMFVKLDNYSGGMEKIQFFDAFKNSLFITVCSVAAIILCTSMCAWYISRVNSKLSSGIYY